MSSTHIILTFLPASYTDLKQLVIGCKREATFEPADFTPQVEVKPFIPTVQVNRFNCCRHIDFIVQLVIRHSFFQHQHHYGRILDGFHFKVITACVYFNKCCVLLSFTTVVKVIFCDTNNCNWFYLNVSLDCTRG